jgi:TatD DNase family protein
MDLFDTHCHLGLDGEGDALAEHGRARAAGVRAVLVVGIDLATSAAARALAARLDGAAWSAGLHPNESGRLPREWDGLRRLAMAAGCAAIGETGLDRHWQRATAAEQERSLRAHLELAHELDKPVILHCREAFAPLFAALADGPRVRGVMHCFSGGVAQARRALDLGLHLSFAGPLTYPRNAALREAAAFAPEAALLVETDAPFLPPQSRRGQRNEPAFLRETLAALAQARGWEPARAARVTWDNACRLFGAPPAAGEERT